MKPRYYQTDAINSVMPPVGKKLIVIPTGGGKSYVMGCLAVDNVLLTGRVLILAHVKELVVQNTDAVLKADRLADIGIICTGIKPADVDSNMHEYLNKYDADITVASVQSVYRKLDMFDDVGLIIVDEAHRIPPSDGKYYRAVMDRFENVPIIGLTATPFRTGSGYLHKGPNKMFDEISYEISHAELVEEGYLTPFANKGSDLAYQTDGLKKVAGEYSQGSLDKLVDDGVKTQQIIDQLVVRAHDRNHWLIFAMSIKHAKMIREFLSDKNITAGIVYGDMDEEGLNREDEIALFKMGVYQALINVNVLTTGFDFPALDCVVLCRPICSPGLFIQCVGRGTRLSPDKENCLVLDYGGNVSRHGDFSNPDIKPATTSKRRKECSECGEKNTMGVRHCTACNAVFEDMFRPCPNCSILVDRAAQKCKSCGYEWPINEMNLDPDGKTIITNKAVWVDVDRWKVKCTKPRQWPGEEMRPEYILIDYFGVDGCKFKEYVFPESHATKQNFKNFWFRHDGKKEMPLTSKEAERRWGELKLPRRVKVIKDGQFFKVLSREV